MIITLKSNHEAVSQLSDLAMELRRTQRGEPGDTPPGLARAITMRETVHGSNSATYVVLPGSASAEMAIEAYQYVRRKYPRVLDILCTAAAHRAVEITIEIGTLPEGTPLTYSQHDLLRIMPRILALFRGTITPI